MLRTYIKVAWRNLLKSRLYSLINIVGLATGMAVAIIIALWIADEVSYNKYHRSYGRLAQVLTTQTFNGETGTGPAIAIPLASELRSKYGDDFKHIALTSWNMSHILAVGEKKISEEGMWAQWELPEMLTLKMLKGSRDALKDPTSILLSESMANRLFGTAEPLNQTVRLDNLIDLNVAGVYEDLPPNTTFYATKFLLPWDSYATTESWVKKAAEQWDNHGFQLFVEMNRENAFEQTTVKIKDIPKPYSKEANEVILLHPMSRWHLYSTFKNGEVAGGQIESVWLFGVTGISVLLLACINFMNLSTARSEKRAKEVGIRKAIGSVRTQLIVQFLCESLVMVLICLVVAAVFVQLSLPYFNGLAGKQMVIPVDNPFFWLMVCSFALFTGILSGSYPAFYLSAFSAIKVLKGTFRAGRYASAPRRILVVLQFSVSVVLMIGTITIIRQIEHAKNRPIGYTRQGLISVEMNTPDLYGHYGAIKSDLLRTGAVENMAESSSATTQIGANNTGFSWKHKDPASNPLFGTIAITHDYGATIRWRVNKGRDFSREFPSDTGAVILNESAVAVMGFKNPVGEIIQYQGKDRMVTGVVKDMVMESPYLPIFPTVFFLDYEWANVIIVRLKAELPAQEALRRIEPVFKKYNPASPFTYHFIDQEYEGKFADELRTQAIVTVFAILAVFISCLGLFGLASFVAEQRTREIGIRKILGASVFSLWGLLCKDFIVLVVIALCIAVPAGYYFMHSWLQNFEYRTDISWLVFAVVALITIVVTVLTVSFQAIKVGMNSPVRSLRAE